MTATATATAETQSSPPRRRSFNAWRGFPIAAGGVAGVLLAAAFAPVGWWWLAPVAVGAHYLAVTGGGRRATWGAAVAFSFVFLSAHLWWMTEVSALGWLLVVLAQGSALTLQGLWIRWCHRWRWGWLWAASSWVAQEAVLARFPFGGFPWSWLAYSQADSPVLGLVAVVGSAGSAMIIAVVGILGARAISPWGGGQLAVRVRRSLAIAGTFAALFIAFQVWPPSAPPVEGSIRVAVVQGGAPGQYLDSDGDRRDVLSRHLLLTSQLGAQGGLGLAARPDVMVWPEGALFGDPATASSATRAIGRVVRSVGAPLLFGAVFDGREVGTTRNVSAAWMPGAARPSVYYDKQRPVPFGEYVPGRKVLDRMGIDIARVPRDMIAGDSEHLVDVAGVRLGTLICFEVAFGDAVRGTVDAGAQALVVQSNNTMFGTSAESEQQLDMARVAAVQHGRDIVVSSTAGLSAIIDAGGQLLTGSGLFEQGVLTAPIDTRTGTTVAHRLEPVIEWSAVVLALLGPMVASGSARVPRASSGGRQPAGIIGSEGAC